MGWTDSHCHLQDEYAASSGGFAPMMERARHAGVDRVVCVGTSESSSRVAAELAAREEGVWATVGLHPHEAVDGVDGVAALLASLAKDRSGVVAVGECGLDYHYDHSPRPAQREAFAAQIALAREHDLALVVHTREAWEDTLAMLTGTAPDRTVIHCFTGGPDQARRCLDLGAWISFSGIVTFKNAHELRAAVSLCPDDRLLVETDAPFLAPVPHRGRSNEPAYLPLVGAALAELRGRPVEEIRDLTARNASAVFAIPAG